MAKPQQRNGSWRIRWTDENGKRQSETYDNYRDAMFAQKQRESEVEEVRRGLRSPAPPAKSFDDLCEYWLEYRASRKRSYEDDASIIRVHLKPGFTGVSLGDLSIQQIDHFIKSKLESRSKKTVANILTLLISMLNVGRELNWISKVPNIKKPPKINSLDYDYLKTEDEIQRFLKAARTVGEDVFAMYSFAIYTGGRAGEIAGVRKSDIELSKRIITFRRSYDGKPLKDNEIRRVPIFNPLLPVLVDWLAQTSGDVVFPNKVGKVHGPSAYIFQETLHKVLDLAGFPKMEIAPRCGSSTPGVKRYIVFHDLRHTFASHWVLNDGSLYKLREMLGHESECTTRRYAHLSPNAFAKDYDRFGHTIQVPQKKDFTCGDVSPSHR